MRIHTNAHRTPAALAKSATAPTVSRFTVSKAQSRSAQGAKQRPKNNAEAGRNVCSILTAIAVDRSGAGRMSASPFDRGDLNFFEHLPNLADRRAFLEYLTPWRMCEWVVCAATVRRPRTSARCGRKSRALPGAARRRDPREAGYVGRSARFEEAGFRARLERL
jgi:hypothetical protein